MKISASLIVKNESSCIRTCLESIKDFVDEIVIVDTGSTDDTVSICQEYTDKVYHGEQYKWKDDFAYHRNQSLELCTGDYIYIIDADEYVPKETIPALRKLANESPETKAFYVKTIGASDETQVHDSIRFFKKLPEIYWKGKAHNYLSIAQGVKTDLKHYYGYSKAHQLDPDRTLRILQKACAEDAKLSRERFYLAREYYYRQQYEECILHLDKYFTVASWFPEIAEAKLLKARCLWQIQKGNEARKSCLEAIGLNPMFKEALLFMAEMHYEPHKSKWIAMSTVANNDDVLFKRV